MLDSTQPTTGHRKITHTMRDRLDQADGFTGLPPGTAKVLQIIGAFKEAEPYLGLPSSAYKLVDWLAKQTRNCDWECGSHPIVWPSARRQEEFMGMTSSGVKKLNQRLYEAGIFVIRDSVQGKRFGRRGPDGRIIEAYGFDLSLLAIRYDEFIRIAAAAKIERDKMRTLRRRKTLIARTIVQTVEELTAQDYDPSEVRRLSDAVRDLKTLAKQASRSDDLGLVVQQLERCQAEADAALRSVISDPEGPLQSPQYNTITTLTTESKDTVAAPVASSRGAEKPSHSWQTPRWMMEVAPALSPYVGGLGWPDLIDGAKRLAADIGISPSLWARACQVMSRQDATTALAIVMTKPANHFTNGPAAYFGGMVKRAERGALNLDRSLWKLRKTQYAN